MTSDDDHLERLRREISRREDGTPAAEPAPPAPAEASLPKKRKAGLAGIGAALLALLAKAKGVGLLLLSALKALKFGKLFLTAGSMALSIWAYAKVFGYRFAVGFVLLIFVHEMGHAFWMKVRGLRASAPIFIPFFGALIAMRDQPRNARIEAEVAIAGPIAGGLGAFVCWGLGAATAQPFWYALAYSGFFLNLFNLLPISPMDGGRIVGAVSRWFWVVGLAVVIPLALAWHHPVLFIFAILGGYRAFRTWRSPEETSAYFDLPGSVRGTIAVAYFGLAGALAMAAIACRPAVAGA